MTTKESSSLYALDVVAGVQRGFRIPVNADPFVMGRDAGVGFRVAEGTVSRRHCELTFDGAGLQLRDLGSRNGTRLNGHPIQGTVPVRPGDSISVGATMFRVVSLAGDDDFSAGLTQDLGKGDATTDH